MATGVSSEPARLSDPGFQASSEDAETPTQGHRLPIFQRLGAGVVENRARIEDDASRRRARRDQGPPGDQPTPPGSPDVAAAKSVRTLRVPDADPRFGKGQALTRTARSNPDLARGRDQGFGQACVPSLNSGVQCGAADLSKSAAAP